MWELTRESENQGREAKPTGPGLTPCAVFTPAPCLLSMDNRICSSKTGSIVSFLVNTSLSGFPSSSFTSTNAVPLVGPQPKPPCKQHSSRPFSVLAPTRQDTLVGLVLFTQVPGPAGFLGCRNCSESAREQTSGRERRRRKGWGVGRTKRAKEHPQRETAVKSNSVLTPEHM